MDKNVALLIGNDQERGAAVRRALDKAARRTGWKLMELHGSSPEDFAPQLDEAEKVFLLFNAVKGSTYGFGTEAKLLLRRYLRLGRKPILIVTAADEDGADLSYAPISLADIWATADPGLSDADTDCTVLYYSYRWDTFCFFPGEFESEQPDHQLLDSLLERDRASV